MKPPRRQRHPRVERRLLVAAVALLVASAGAFACTADDPLLSSDGPPGEDGPDGGTPDVVVDGGGAADGSAPAPRCDPAKPFDRFTPVPGMNTDGDDNFASFSPDERDAYIGRAAQGAGPQGRDILYLTRPTADAAFGPATAIAGVSSAYEDDNPTITADGLALYFHSSRPSTDGGPAKDLDLFVARRAAVTTSFASAEPITTLNTAALESDPFVLPDQSSLYFGSTRDGTYRMYRADRVNDAFPTSQPLGGLVPGAGTVTQPVLSDDGLTIYFAFVSVDAGGSLDVWTASRSTTLTDFGPASLVAELATASAELPTWVSPDRCHLYFVSDRPGGAGGRDIWLAERPR